MTLYIQPFWGFKIDLPKGWVHQAIQDSDGFASHAEALTPGYEGPDLGHLLVRGEWNPTRKDIQPLWSQHVTRLSIMLAAKKLGSAPWLMGGGQGFEAEILLPKTTGKRLWVGILSYDRTILHFMVSHWMTERPTFEPIVTEIIRSLRFIPEIQSVQLTEEGIPIPPGYETTDPQTILTDLLDHTGWQAYQGAISISALQAFYWRELQNQGFNMEEYIPYPSETRLGFARFRFTKGQRSFNLGILPVGPEPSNGDIIIKSNAGKAANRT
jgi:hypothetical protein